jgi:group II intron reverse transcriptase/maturase/CRISPR-associated protein Cas4
MPTTINPVHPPRYVDLADRDRLRRGWRRVWRAHGAFGGDGQTLGEFRAGVGPEIARLQEELLARRYRPGPLRGCRIPKPGGGERRLLIPSARDRVVQQAALSLLGPWLEPHFETTSWAYRPGRSHSLALRMLQRAWREGYRWIAEGDVEQFFDRIDRRRLASLLDQYIDDREFVDLVMTWVGGRSGLGIPQGSPVSPLLSNLYLDRFDEEVGLKGRRLVRFGDDFVIATRSHGEAADALVDARKVLNTLGLRLKSAKTAIRGPAEGIAFLGAEMSDGNLESRPRPAMPPLPRHQVRSQGDGWDLWFPSPERQRFREDGDWDAAPPVASEDDSVLAITCAARPAGSVPVSALRDLLYCPHAAFRRLCLGESPDSPAMRRGREEHTGYQPDTVGAREVPIASRRLGLTGRVDLLERRGGRTVVVELKSGLARSPTLADAVQVSAYALILAEHQPDVAAELAFTGSRRREPIPLTPWLTTRTRLLIRETHDIRAGHWEPSNRERVGCAGCRHRSPCRGD